MLEEAWEKINIPAKWRELKEMGKKHGKRFFVLAVIWELIEDGLFPYLSWKFGVPELIPIFLVLHFEPVVYPVFFFALKTYDRIRGREPWDPERSAYSKSYRTLAKVVVYRAAATLAFAALMAHLDVSLWALSIYTVVMTLFSAVHERIWHDSNYGIDPVTDDVHYKRNIVKSLSYRTVSTIMMSGVLLALLGSVPWGVVIAYQAVMAASYLGLETMWSKISWGLAPTSGS
jgi:hypothetical protein